MKKNGKTVSRFLVGLVAAIMLLSVAAPALARRSEPIYYPNNTVCSFGPYFRYVTDPLTDKWYTFTPLDLSKDGAQSYMLIASNKRIIGEITVAVAGDEVTVTYSYKKNVWDLSQSFAIFKDYDSITAADLEQAASPYEYGKPISIKNDLGGDTDVLLCVLNRVTYKVMPRDVKRAEAPKIPWFRDDPVLKTFYPTSFRQDRLDMAAMAGLADRYKEPDLVKAEKLVD